MQALIEYFLHRNIFVNLLTVILIGVGTFIALTMNREAFPNINFDLVVVTTIYRGASPQEVEKLVTIPIEETIKEVDGIKEFRSSSIENRSSISVVIDPDVEDTQKVIDDVRAAVDRAEDLPEDAERPILTEASTARQPIIEWSLSRNIASIADYTVLRDHAEQLENEFLAMPEVARVERRGWLDREIFIDIDPALLAQNYIDTTAIGNALRERNINLPGGDINLGKKEVIIRTVGEFEDAEEISRMFIRSNDVGNNIQLRDLAVVREGFAEPETLEGIAGVHAIGLTVVKRQSADIINTVNQSKRIVMEFAPHQAIVHIPYPGRDRATVEKDIVAPLRAYADQHFRKPRGWAMFKSPPLVTRYTTEIQDGQAQFHFYLNPDNIEDSELDERDEIFNSMFLELKAELEEARGVLPSGAGQFSIEYEDLHEGTHLRDVNDISYLVKRRLGVLVSNGVTGLILVVGSLFIFMGWRTSIMVALGIPISFGMAFIAMSYLGVTMNLISMFSLVIVIGIVVDDAIIVSENIYRYMEEGYDFFEATSKGSAEVFAPVLATVSTTIAAFAPMMFMTGIFGKFMYTIPLVIILTLIASLIECFLILPSHVYDMNKFFPGGKLNEEGGHWFQRVRDRLYKPSLTWALNHRWIFIVGMIALMFISIFLNVAFGSFKLFPSAIDALYARVSLPSGTTLEGTDRYVQAFGESVRKLPDIDLDTYVTRAGIQRKEGNDPFVKRGNNYGMLLVFLEPELDRNMSADEVIEFLGNETEWMLGPEALRNKKARDQEVILKALEAGRLKEAIRTAAVVYNIPPEFQDLYEEARPTAEGWFEGAGGFRYKKSQDEEAILKALDAGDLKTALRIGSKVYDMPTSFPVENRGALSIEIEKLGGGPPVGKDIAVEITGESLNVLEQIAEDYKEVVRRATGVRDVDDDFLEGKDEIRLRIDEQLASRAGVSVLQIASAVNTAFEGTVASSIKRPEEEVDIRVRFAEQFRNDRSALNKIYVSNRQGNLIPVSTLARFEEGEGITVINHLDGKRLITVTANVDEKKTTSAAANKEIAQLGKSVGSKYPGYKIAFGGQNKDTEESLASLGRAFAVGVLVIFMILASLFRSLIQPVIVLMAVPFSLIGVILAFLVHGEPMSFLAFMGIIGLSGVVVNDSIVLVDFANRIRETRPEMSNREVAVEAGVMRLRAVLLTTITTVAGLIPTAYGIGGYDPFLVPMALSFAWGLAFATVLTLGLVPIFYSMVLDSKDWMREFWSPGGSKKSVPGGGHGMNRAGLIGGTPNGSGTRDAEYGLSEEYQVHDDPTPRNKKKKSRGG